MKIGTQDIRIKNFVYFQNKFGKPGEAVDFKGPRGIEAETDFIMVTARYYPKLNATLRTGFLILLTAAAFIPASGLWLSRFEGWMFFLSLTFAGLVVVAAISRQVTAWATVPAAILVTMSDRSTAVSGGLMLLGIGFAIGGCCREQVSLRTQRLIGVLTAGWLGWALYGWWFRYIAPAEISDGFIRLFTPDWPLQSSWGSADWPLGNANPMAGFLIMLIPLGVVMTIRERANRLWRMPWAVGTLLLVGLCLGTGSRTGLAALPAAGLIALYLLPSERLSRSKKLGLALAIGVGTVGLVLARPGLRESLFSRASKSYSDSIRWDFLETGWNLFLRHPWTGVGPGQIPARYAEALSAYSDQPGCQQLHNTAMQWLVEFGVLGGLLWVALAVATVWGLRRALVSPQLCPIRVGASVSATAFIFYSLTDYQFHLPVTAAIFGLCLATSWDAAKLNPLGKNWVIGAKLGVLLAAFAVFARLADGAPARWYSSQAQNCLLRGDLTSAQTAWAESIKLNPESAVYPAIAASYLADHASPRDRLEKADRLWELAIANAPQFPYLQVARGWLWVDTDPVRATSYFKSALQLAPKLPQAWVGLARAYSRLGDREACLTALTMRSLILPETAFSPDLRTGFFPGAAKQVWARLREHAGLYRSQYPDDRRQDEALVRFIVQLDAWEKSGMNGAVFIRQNPDWSRAPLWRRLSAIDFTLSADETLPLSSRLLASSLLHHLMHFEVKDGDASDWLKQASLRPGDFSGYRTMMAPERFEGLGAYLGDSTSIMAPIYLASYDGVAHALVYEGDPVKPRLCGDYFRAVLKSRIFHH